MPAEALQTVRVNGLTLHYAVYGEGAKPVVLVHGNGEDHTLFGTQVRQLTAAGYRVVAPDSRGHGANPPLAEYHYADMAEDVFQLIRALGLVKPAYYGHSDGGIIGLETELLHPGTLGMMAVSGTNLHPEGLRPDFLAACRAEQAREPSPLIELMLTEPRIDPAALAGVTLPVLVTAGEYDLVLPEETARLAEALPRAELVIVSGADHGSYIQGSETMGRLLLDFFRRCETGAFPL